MRVLGVMPAYNEEDCIANTVRAMGRVCDEIHVFDHGSTDRTALILHALDVIDGLPVVRIHVDRGRVPIKDADGVQSFALWHRIAAHALAHVGEFDWLVWSDADDLLREPDGRLATKAGLEREDARGIQVVRPLIREFWLTEQDAPEGNYLDQRHYLPNSHGHSPRAWRIELTPPNLPAGAHVQDPAIKPKRYPHYEVWPEGTRVSNNEWLLDQYPIRTESQARRKVLHDRDWLMPVAGRRRRYGGLIDGNGGICDVRRGASTMVHEARELEMP